MQPYVRYKLPNLGYFEIRIFKNKTAMMMFPNFPFLIIQMFKESNTLLVVSFFKKVFKKFDTFIYLLKLIH